MASEIPWEHEIMTKARFQIISCLDLVIIVTYEMRASMPAPIPRCVHPFNTSMRQRSLVGC